MKYFLKKVLTKRNRYDIIKEMKNTSLLLLCKGGEKMIILKCDRCKKELHGVDDANLLKYNNKSAYTLSTMHWTDIQLLDGGDNCILCESCMEDFKIFMGNK